MSKNYFCLCISVLAVSTLLLASCDKEESETIFAPSLSLNPTAVVASADGGAYSFSYVVSNPAEDGTVSASGAADWIEDLTDTGSGFSFTLAANSSATRIGRITVTYTSSYGILGETVTIIQNATVAPTLSVQPVAVMAGAEGGSYSFSYSVTDRPEGSTLNCTTTANWISDFTYPADGKVNFTVAQNETSSLREADITVVFESSYGIIEQTVAVIQDYTSGSDGGGETPSIVGTYRATGIGYVDAGVAGEITWTMKIYQDSEGYFIDGLVPESAGLYPGTEAYIARASLTSAGTLVIPSQLTGYIHKSTGYFIGWTPCVKFDEKTGWSYSRQGPDCTFTYDAATDTWTSDYGEFLALFEDKDDPWNAFNGFFDVVNPGMKITKISDSTDSMGPASVRSFSIEEGLVLHTDLFSAE